MKTTIITLAYNHERYIREALSSAIAQSIAADEIIVIDDASGDNTAAAIEAFIREHPESPFNFIRNERNLGLTASFAKAVAIARGDVLLMMAGDDVSAPVRVERCVDYLSAHPSAKALITNADIIDGESRRCGVLDNCAGMAEPVSLGLEGLQAWTYFLRGRSSCGAAAAYRAEVFSSFSPLSPGLFAEDDPAAFRAMLLGTCDFLPERLVAWRRHATNLSYGSGSVRGPGMAIQYRKCEAMVEEMIADAGEWVMRHELKLGNEFGNAVSSLRFYKSKWALWAAAHESGLSLHKFFSAVKEMAEIAPPPSLFLKEVWRPAFRMFTPFLVQRLMVNIRSLR